MFKPDSRGVEEIDELETRIVDLRDAIARSRRLMLAGRAGAATGLVLLACLLVGLIDFTPVRMIVALALAIGGVVLSGSSRSSTEQLERSLARLEAERSAAIDGAELVRFGE